MESDSDVRASDLQVPNEFDSLFFEKQEFQLSSSMSNPIRAQPHYTIRDILPTFRHGNEFLYIPISKLNGKVGPCLACIMGQKKFQNNTMGDSIL